MIVKPDVGSAPIRGCTNKIKYASIIEARRALRAGSANGKTGTGGAAGTMHPYRCDTCASWHLGRARNRKTQVVRHG